MNSLINKLKKTGLKESSINVYTANIKKLSDLLNFKRFTLKYLNDYESIIDFIKTKSEWSLATQRNYMTSILVVSKAGGLPPKIHDKYLEYHTKLTGIQTDAYADNLQTEKEQKNWITHLDISNKIEELKKQTKTAKSTASKLDSFQKYLILNLYSLLPPLRNDYAGDVQVHIKERKVSEAKETCNSICLETKVFTLCNYKTSKVYGIKKINIPEPLIEIIQEWISLRKELKVSTKYLLIQIKSPENYMTKNHLTKTINNIFHPKKVSTTILRKVYLSEKYPVSHSYREMQKDAYVMGHDINTAKMVYSKKL